jgi:hypothetical protein
MRVHWGLQKRFESAYYAPALGAERWLNPQKSHGNGRMTVWREHLVRHYLGALGMSAVCIIGPPPIYVAVTRDPGAALKRAQLRRHDAVLHGIWWFADRASAEATIAGCQDLPLDEIIQGILTNAKAKSITPTPHDIVVSHAYEVVDHIEAIFKKSRSVVSAAYKLHRRERESRGLKRMPWMRFELHYKIRLLYDAVELARERERVRWRP